MTIRFKHAGIIVDELRKHAPFTAVGTLSGIAVLLLSVHLVLSKTLSATFFWTFHPLHVVLSAMVTTGVYRLHSNQRICSAVIVGLIGSIGIATLSDSVIPFIGEWLLDLPNRDIHIGFIEKWWLVNPLALMGVMLGYFFPTTTLPHAGHVLLSVWASLFHIIMSLGTNLTTSMVVSISIFLFLAVWVPCCTSDIVFPLLWIKKFD